MRLRDAAEAVAEGEWGRTVLVEGDGEVASLARSFNRMSARVAAAHAAQQEFVGDVSHELKTPLTNIRMYAELLDEALEDGDETSRAHVQVIVDESRRLSRLIGNVLTFARQG
ncbi:MAG: sensor histidine kinase, partial [Coriobacteriaceae bacterium]|nr:sensor histidine kinase [Coriobacteriaceae bacterium]